MPSNELNARCDRYIQERATAEKRRSSISDTRADDLKLGPEREIKEIDRQIKEARRAPTAVLTLEEKLVGQKRVKALESRRNENRRSLFDAQDEIDRRREQIIAEIEGKLQQRVSQFALFSIHWSLA